MGIKYFVYIFYICLISEKQKPTKTVKNTKATVVVEPVPGPSGSNIDHDKEDISENST